MLSRQCDELRKEAKAIDDSNAGRMMRDAADVIEGLRLRADDLMWENSALRDENKKLHELEGAVNEFLGDLPCNDCALRRDCDDNNRVLCNELSFHAMENVRRLASITEVE